MEGMAEDGGVGWTCWRSISDRYLTPLLPLQPSLFGPLLLYVLCCHKVHLHLSNGWVVLIFNIIPIADHEQGGVGDVMEIEWTLGQKGVVEDDGVGQTCWRSIGD